MKPIQQRGRPLTDLAKNVTACYHASMRARDDLSTYSDSHRPTAFFLTPPPSQTGQRLLSSPVLTCGGIDRYTVKQVLVKSELPGSWRKNSLYLIQTWSVSKAVSVSCKSTEHSHIYLILILPSHLCLCPQPVDGVEISWQTFVRVFLSVPKTSKILTSLRDIFKKVYTRYCL
jgi:hypothetical protein